MWFKVHSMRNMRHCFRNINIKFKLSQYSCFWVIFAKKRFIFIMLYYAEYRSKKKEIIFCLNTNSKVVLMKWQVLRTNERTTRQTYPQTCLLYFPVESRNVNTSGFIKIVYFWQSFGGKNGWIFRFFYFKMLNILYGYKHTQEVETGQLMRNDIRWAATLVSLILAECHIMRGQQARFTCCKNAPGVGGSLHVSDLNFL